MQTLKCVASNLKAAKLQVITHSLQASKPAMLHWQSDHALAYNQANKPAMLHGTRSSQNPVGLCLPQMRRRMHPHRIIGHAPQATPTHTGKDARAHTHTLAQMHTRSHKSTLGREGHSRLRQWVRRRAPKLLFFLVRCLSFCGGFATCLK